MRSETRTCTSNNVDARCKHDKTTLCSSNYLCRIPLISRLFRNPSVSLSNFITQIPLAIECKARATGDSNEVLNCKGRRVRSKGVPAESTMTVSRYYLGYRCVTLAKIAYSATLRILSEMYVFFLPCGRFGPAESVRTRESMHYNGFRYWDLNSRNETHTNLHQEINAIMGTIRQASLSGFALLPRAPHPHRSNILLLFKLTKLSSFPNSN